MSKAVVQYITVTINFNFNFDFTCTPRVWEVSGYFQKLSKTTWMSDHFPQKYRQEKIRRGTSIYRSLKREVPYNSRYIIISFSSKNSTNNGKRLKMKLFYGHKLLVFFVSFIIRFEIYYFFKATENILYWNMMIYMCFWHVTSYHQTKRVEKKYLRLMDALNKTNTVKISVTELLVRNKLKNKL